MEVGQHTKSTVWVKQAGDQVYPQSAGSVLWLLKALRYGYHSRCNAVVTPLRKAASYEPRIAILGIWGDTWLTRANTASTWQYVVVTGPLRGLCDAFCRVKSALSTAVAVTRIPSLVLCNTWHYVIIRYSQWELPKFVLRCSYKAALRKGVTMA